MWNAQVTSLAMTATGALLLASANIARVSGSEDSTEFLQVGRYSVLAQQQNAVPCYPKEISGSDLNTQTARGDSASEDSPQPVHGIPNESEVGPDIVVDTLSTYGPVKQGETLSEIARRIYPDSTFSMPRLLFALFYRNSEAFTDSNINQLHRDVLLQVPTDEELYGVDPQEALAEYRRHYRLWQQSMVEGK